MITPQAAPQEEAQEHDCLRTERIFVKMVKRRSVRRQRILTLARAGALRIRLCQTSSTGGQASAACRRSLCVLCAGCRAARGVPGAAATPRQPLPRGLSQHSARAHMSPRTPRRRRAHTLYCNSNRARNVARNGTCASKVYRERPFRLSTAACSCRRNLSAPVHARA